MNETIVDKFIQANSPDGGFLQSEEWRKFQESYGRKTFHLEGDGFWANIIEHKLKFVGNYFYVPRGPIASLESEEFPISNFQFPIKSQFQNSKFSNFLLKIIELAKKEKAGWIRIEPVNKSVLDLLGGFASKLGLKLKKAPHDMQTREILVMDIAKPEEQLLSEMKSKTRYNIKLAQKKGVAIKSVDNLSSEKKYFEKFLRLVKITAERNKIAAHLEEYYRKMWETLPAETLKLYVAEYKNKIIAANLVPYYGKFATYLHGASDNEFREMMAPHLLQWQAILDAKMAGYNFYDLGGISSSPTALGRFGRERSDRYDSWRGITKFKSGFAPGTKPIEFPGSYDIIINSRNYSIYRILQFVKTLWKQKKI